MDRFEGRYVDRGSLGCPVCRAEYPVDRGAADFRAPAAASAARGAPAPAGPGATATGVAPSDQDVLRLRALLDLGEPGGIVVLAGAVTSLAAVLEDAVDVTTLLINPGDAFERRAGRSVLLVERRVPLAAGSVRSAAVGADMAQPGILEGLALALRAGGRLVGPVGAALPPGMQELARDGSQWVAARMAGPDALVRLGRR